MIPSSLAMEGADAAERIAYQLISMPMDSPRARAFWAIVGCLVADAAAQPTQWNYKVPYFHQELCERSRWDDPEFMRPSLNTFYRVPLGSHSAYGDMTVEVLQSMVALGDLDPADLENR